MKLDTIQLRFPVISSKTNPCPQLVWSFAKLSLKQQPGKWNKKKGGGRVGNWVFLFGKIIKQMLHEQVCTHSTQEQSIVQPAEVGTQWPFF